MLRKARKFAAKYTVKDLDLLISLCRKKEYGFGLSHMIRLLGIADDQAREQLQAKAIKGEWSVSKLDIAILKRFPKPDFKAGRWPQKLDSLADAYFQISRLCDQWRRFSLWLQFIDPGEHWDKMAADVRADVEKAQKVMVALGKLAAQKLPAAGATGEARTGKAGRPARAARTSSAPTRTATTRTARAGRGT